ncbi:MAG TPA: c-type cytochrome [Thermoanaerobaculaceae bacterium]|nr:c-type cytochrome [Thermoanaerobaculaceae bacterium]
MGEKTAKWVFWAGTLSSLVLFLALTFDTNKQFAALTNADRLDEQVVAGKRAFERHNCNDCHTILGFGGYYAPDLTRAYRRVGEDAIKRRLEHPETALAASYRKMPQQHLSQQEVTDITAFLRWVGEIDNHDWPPQDSTARWKRSTDRLLASASMSPAAALIQQESCLSCHALGDRGESKGPRLEWIGARRGADYIAQYLADPEKVAPGAEMPAFDHLSQGQREMIGEFIVALAGLQGR